MAKGMGCDGLGNTATAIRLVTGFLNGMAGDGLVGTLAGEQPVRRSFRAPPVAQRFQQSERQHDISVLCAGKGYVPRITLQLQEIPAAAGCRSCLARGQQHITMAVLLG